MKIVLNGEQVDIEGKTNISGLLGKYSIDNRKVAVERNLEIVSKSDFDDVYINENDRIEIIHFIGGG